MSEPLELCVILNGPPGCGKDTLSNIFAGYGFHQDMMKYKLYEDTAEYFGVDLQDLIVWATNRTLKEQEWDELVLDHKPISPRQALIHVSENIIKPREGKDYFGIAAADRCRRSGAPYVVFSDGGFPEEVSALSNTFRNTFIFRLHRKGFTFAGDSRDYLQGFPNTFDIALIDGEPEVSAHTILSVTAQYTK